MLTIRLVTIEDENAEAIYEPIHAQLEDWLFARRGIIELRRPASTSEHLVTNLEEWHALLPQLSGPDQLVFCTVDLAIPTAAGGSPEMKHGLAVVNEIRARHGEGWRCCILTGMASADLQRWLGDNIPEVLFEFKGDRNGYTNIVNYIKSQCFPLLETLAFTGHDGRTHQILLVEVTGRIRDHYLSKAPYYADVSTWHVPTLIVGERGMGHRTFIEFVAYLADATTEVIELAMPEDTTEADRLDYNEAVFERLQEILAAFDGTAPRHLFFVSGLDRYRPERDAEEGYDCLRPLRAILERLRALGSRNDRGFPFGIIFSVSAESRLRIQSPTTRGFVRLLEETIAEMTDFPLQHLGLDENGWTLDHPRILRAPSLHDHGKPFIGRFIASQLACFRAELHERLPGYQGQPLTLSADLLDFLTDDIDWGEHGNISGLSQTLKNLFLNFLDNRANHQYQMTVAHLDADFRERFQCIVLNVDDVSLAFPDAAGKMQPVVKRADFKLHRGELLVILGPSGCGKSTILRMLSGLLAPTEGRVTYFQEPLLKPTEKIGFIFQDYSLFPWLTIRRNVEFGPRLRGVDRSQLAEKVNHLFEIAKLQDKENDYPRDLSGGQQQRAAIIRSLANEPDVLLMDEPFSALDVQTRWEMQRFLVEKVMPLGKSVAFVTHDIDEAVFVADRILIASPRPLVLCDEVRIPFSTQERTDALRRDPVFVALVDQVRDSLLRAAAQMEDRGAAH